MLVQIKFTVAVLPHESARFMESVDIEPFERRVDWRIKGSVCSFRNVDIRRRRTYRYPSGSRVLQMDDRPTRALR